jgi:hypothetical protein
MDTIDYLGVAIGMVMGSILLLAASIWVLLL